MPTYRIFYAAREATEEDKGPFQDTRLGGLGIHRQDAYAETEWEELIEADSGPKRWTPSSAIASATTASWHG